MSELLVGMLLLWDVGVIVVLCLGLRGELRDLTRAVLLGALLAALIWPLVVLPWREWLSPSQPAHRLVKA